MTILLKVGSYKIAKTGGTAENTGGSAADITTTITVNELEAILDVISITVAGAGGPYILRSYSISGNTISVTVNVPAGDTATIEVVVLGY